MNYLPLLILLTLVTILSVLIDRRRAHKVAAAAQPEASVVTLAADPAATTPTGVMTRLANQWSQRFGRKPPVSDDPVRAWLAALFVENPAERVWFASLTPEQFKLLRRELTTFCAELGFDLTWLVEGASFKPAVLEQTGKAIVTHYCRAVRAAVLVQGDMKALQRYQAFLTAPTSKEQLAFGQQLFARLVDERLAPAATPEILMAGEKERQTFMVQAIQAAAEQNATAFSAVLKALVLGVPQPTPAAPETMAPPTWNGASAPSHVAV
jgi:hypothetical protein